jgi:hypothetical protein
MSALPPTADIDEPTPSVRFVPITDILRRNKLRRSPGGVALLAINNSRIRPTSIVLPHGGDRYALSGAGSRSDTSAIEWRSAKTERERRTSDAQAYSRFGRACRTAARQHKLPCCVEIGQSELPTALMEEDRGYEHGECECHGACPEES